MAGFMKNVMSYVGMADVPEDDDYTETEAPETSFAVSYTHLTLPTTERV